MVERQKSILIVDDSEIFLTYISMMLDRMGYKKIIPATNGKQALQLIKLFMPDIILFDIEMLDSIKTLKHIKDDEQTSNIPIIMLTTIRGMEIETYEECKKIGFFGHLEKPVNIIKLNDILNKCITYEEGKKRKFLRTNFEKKVAVTHEGETKELRAINLSEGGIYIRKIDPFPVGTEVEIALPLKKKTLKLKGTVVYTKCISGDLFKIAPGMAIEFKELSSEDSAILNAYIIELLTGDILEEQEEAVIEQDDRIIYL
jgi:CheY-like chemotaxis protein